MFSRCDVVLEMDGFMHKEQIPGYLLLIKFA